MNLNDTALKRQLDYVERSMGGDLQTLLDLSEQLLERSRKCAEESAVSSRRLSEVLRESIRMEKRLATIGAVRRVPRVFASIDLERQHER